MDNLFEQVQILQNLLIGRATGSNNTPYDEKQYLQLRHILIFEPELKTLIPQFIKDCRDLNQFWDFIQPQFETYKERKTYLRKQFTPLLDILEFTQTAPADTIISQTIEKIDTHHIQTTWNKALKRRSQDPEGAITSARTLIEDVCKHILDEAGENYDDGLELPKLYQKTAKILNLSPSQHTEEVFKQILSGCISVIQGLGTIRNRISDSHGKGKKNYVKPAPRHAELAVNLSGAMASYLLNTWESTKEKAKE